MQLKPYQTRALDALRTFLEAARYKPHGDAYAAACRVGRSPAPMRAAYRAAGRLA